MRFLVSDRLGRIGVAVLAPVDIDAAMSRWRAGGGSSALVWGRWAVLQSALVVDDEHYELYRHRVAAYRFVLPRGAAAAAATPSDVMSTFLMVPSRL